MHIAVLSSTFFGINVPPPFLTSKNQLFISRGAVLRLSIAVAIAMAGGSLNLLESLIQNR
jgi:hypothetical protein